MTLQENMHKLGIGLKKYAPEILTSVSVAGLAATTYLASRAGFKSGLVVMADAAARIDETPDGEETVFMTPKEVLKETWKFYIPVVVVGVVTGVAVVGSHRISANRNVALISAAAISERALSEYQSKMVETTSKPKERRIQDDIAQDKVNEKRDELDRLVIAKDGDVMVIETHTQQVFVSNAEKIHRAENDANRVCLDDGFISLNVFLDKLGLPHSDAGEVVGWNNKKPLEVVIGGAAHDEKPVLTIGYRTPPSVTFANDPW
jgi:hypothetical protein